MITLHTSKIIKVGNSIAVIIPKNLKRALLLERGDIMITAVAEGNVICMRKVTDEEKMQLKNPIININK